jgi:hypothetical protein
MLGEGPRGPRTIYRRSGGKNSRLAAICRGGGGDDVYHFVDAPDDRHLGVPPAAPPFTDTIAWRKNAMSTTGDLENTTYRRLGMLLVVIGALFAVGHVFGLEFIYKLWPLLTLGLGIGFLGIYSVRRHRGVLYLALGAYLMQFSGLAMYLNVTNWGQLATLWPLFIGFMGVVFAARFAVHRRRVVLFLALLMFLMTAFAFIMQAVGTKYWWTVFFLLGLSILVSGRKRS